LVAIGWLKNEKSSDDFVSRELNDPARNSADLTKHLSRNLYPKFQERNLQQHESHHILLDQVIGRVSNSSRNSRLTIDGQVFINYRSKSDGRGMICADYLRLIEEARAANRVCECLSVMGALLMDANFTGEEFGLISSAFQNALAWFRESETKHAHSVSASFGIRRASLFLLQFLKSQDPDVFCMSPYLARNLRAYRSAILKSSTR
jgi:hypothetical protein